MLFRTLFTGNNLPVLVALVVFAVLIFSIIVARMMQASKRWTLEDRAFYERLGRYQRQQAVLRLVVYAILLSIMLVAVALARR